MIFPALHMPGWGRFIRMNARNITEYPIAMQSGLSGRFNISRYPDCLNLEVKITPPRALTLSGPGTLNRVVQQ